MTTRRLTLAEAAPLVGLTASSLRRYALRGDLRAELLGKTWVTTEAEAQRFAAVARRPGPRVRAAVRPR